MSSIEKAMQRQAEKKKFGQKNEKISDTEVEQKISTEATADGVESKAENTQEQTPVADKPTVANNAASDAQAAAEKTSGNEQEKETSETELSVSAESEQKVEGEESLAPVSKDLHINTAELEDKGFVALSKKRTLINEEFRSIKRKVLTNAFGPLSKTLNHSNLVLVSSSRPNEGKTFTAVNLALSMALEQDKTVLLVDADVLKPSVSKTLNIGANVGLIEYLTGEVENVGDVIYHTNIENLKVLPAGLPHHLSNELLSSDKMQKLFEEFATRYPDRVVVFDCPPLLGVNETALMAAQCGQGVIVVEELRSKVSEVKKATELLPEEMAVGFVLNKVVETNDADSYGYGYYYSTGE